jgi:ketosteroid isomerase-like protein
MRIISVICLGLLVWIYGCVSKPDVEGARSVSSQIGEALNSKDIERLETSLADDAILLNANEPAFVGREAIVSRYATGFKEIDYSVSLESEEIKPAGTFLIERGLLTGNVKTTDGRTSAPVSGKYLHVLKSQAGAWKIWRGAWDFNVALGISCSQTGSKVCCCEGTMTDCIKKPTGGCPDDRAITVLLP